MFSSLLQQVSPILAGDQRSQEFLPEKLTMLLLLRGSRTWLAEEEWPDADLKQQWQQLVETSMVSIVESEVLYMRQQLQHIDDVLLEKKDAAAACDTCELSPECHLKDSMGVPGGGADGSSQRSSSSSRVEGRIKIAAAAKGGGGEGGADDRKFGEVAAVGCCDFDESGDEVRHSCCS
jgi:hypothetical protein